MSKLKSTPNRRWRLYLLLGWISLAFNCPNKEDPKEEPKTHKYQITFEPPKLTLNPGGSAPVKVTVTRTEGDPDPERGFVWDIRFFNFVGMAPLLLESLPTQRGSSFTLNVASLPSDQAAEVLSLFGSNPGVAENVLVVAIRGKRPYEVFEGGGLPVSIIIDPATAGKRARVNRGKTAKIEVWGNPSFGTVTLPNLKLSSFTIANQGGQILVDKNVVGKLQVNSATIQVNPPTALGEFRLGNNPTPLGLDPNRTSVKELQVIFEPLSEGPKSAVLQISSNDPKTPVLTLNLTGQGVLGE